MKSAWTGQGHFYDSVILPSNIIEFYPDPTLVVGACGCVVAWNRAIEEMTGVRKEDMPGKRGYEYALPFYGERKPILLDMFGMPKKKFNKRYTDLVVGDGRLEALRRQNAKLKRWDQRQKSQQAELSKVYEQLKESEEKYRLITTSTNDGIVTVDRDGNITYINPNGINMIGLDEASIIGQHFTRFVAEEYQELALIEFSRSMSGEYTASFEIMVLSPAGHIPVELSGSSLNSAGGIKGVIVSFRNVSELKKAREELRKAHEELDRHVEERTAELKEAKEQAELYLDLMGHDINNKNLIAMGYLEMLLGPGIPEDGIAAFIDRSLAMLQDSSRLIENVQKIQKAVGGRIKLERVDLDVVLKEVCSEFSMVPGRDIAITYRPVNDCIVMGNQLLKDVFSNIIGNAIKHSTGPLNVTIGVSRRKSGTNVQYMILVEDDGPGIPDHIKKVLFTRMMRGMTHAKGNGLGLYLVKTLVEKASTAM